MLIVLNHLHRLPRLVLMLSSSLAVEYESSCFVFYRRHPSLSRPSRFQKIEAKKSAEGTSETASVLGLHPLPMRPLVHCRALYWWIRSYEVNQIVDQGYSLQRSVVATIGAAVWMLGLCVYARLSYDQRSHPRQTSRPGELEKTRRLRLQRLAQKQLVARQT